MTEVDVAVERMFRALIAERFPDHDVLAEELDVQSTGARHRWVFDPLDGTTNFAHGVPIFCASLALEIDGEAEVAAVYDPNRRELFTAERGVGAWLNGRRDSDVGRDNGARLDSRHRIPVHRARGPRALPARVRPRAQARAGRAPPGLGRDRSVLGGRRPHGSVLGSSA